MTVLVVLSGYRQGRLQVLQGGRGQERRGRHPRRRITGAQGDRLMRQWRVIIIRGDNVDLSTRALYHFDPSNGGLGMEAAVSCRERYVGSG